VKKPLFEEAINKTLSHEGGFVNDPKDSGGATNFGITQATLTAWRKKPVTVADVKNMTRAEAVRIYKHEYWFKNSLDQVVSHVVAEEIFDSAVNTGRTAIRFVQDLCNEQGYKLVRDGIMGAKTVNALNTLIQKLGEVSVHDRLNALQEKFYYDLVKRRPKDQRFLKGWLRLRVKYINKAPTV
jgi:lysozyme family protein